MATNFLYATGTNGYIVTPFDVLTTGLNTLTTGSTATSAALSQSDTVHAVWGKIWFTSGGAFTPSTGVIPHLAGWFLGSPDGGTAFEKAFANADMPRAPDFVIPFVAGSALASTDVVDASGLIRLWPDSTKVFLRNNSGVSLPASGNKITVGPVAIQY